MDKGKVANWLEMKYLEWQTNQGRRRSMRAFSDYLGVIPMTLNHWVNGDNLPEKYYVDKLADKLGPEIYDLMGLTRPDPNLMYIVKRWPTLTEQQRKIIREQAEHYAGLDETVEDMEPVETRGTKNTA